MSTQHWRRSNCNNGGISIIGQLDTPTWDWNWAVWANGVSTSCSIACGCGATSDDCGRGLKLNVRQAELKQSFSSRF